MTTAVINSAAGNLPVELSSFVGRDRELREVRRLVSSAHVITLTGPGGIGKSRLAVRAAHRLGRSFADGVWMVELAELDSPDLLPYALARALGVYESSDDINLALVGYLRERRVLLVLDNCEHLLEACRRLVASLVSGCERVRVLCTSRERLDVPGEAVVAVSALDVPADGEWPPAAALADVDALRLLVDRAVAVAPEFALTDDNCVAASEICRRLDGLPLAIELAAVRLASMTADDLRDRLDDRLRLLAATHGLGPERSQTLRATVDWSYELLSQEERVLWQRLSVFAGSFSLEAAEEVCSGAGLERWRIVDLVAGLVAKSVLTMGHGSRRGRYRLLETLRLYGAQRLAEVGGEVELARRHARWYAELISGGDHPWWGRPSQAEMLQTLDVESPNVEAALDFCGGSPPDAEIGLRMAADLWLYWSVRGRYRAGSRHLDTVLRAFLTLVPEPTPARAMATWALGLFAWFTGDFAAGRSRFEQARLVAEQTGAERELAFALNGLGLVQARSGEIESAIELLTRARDIMAKLDDPAGLALATYFLATAVAATGKLAEARQLASQGLAASEQSGDSFARGFLNGLLGTVQWQLDDPAAGESSFKEAIRVQQLIGHRVGLLTSLEGLAWLAGSTGRPQRAALMLGAAAAVFEEIRLTPILPPYWGVNHAACEETVRAGLGETEYRIRWDQGFALSRDQAVVAALEGAPPGDRDEPTAAIVPDVGELSTREVEVAKLVAEGLTNRAIASELFVSVATVKTHVSHILSKLGLDSRVQLAGWVAADGSAQREPERR